MTSTSRPESTSTTFRSRTSPPEIYNCKNFIGEHRATSGCSTSSLTTSSASSCTTSGTTSTSTTNTTTTWSTSTASSSSISSANGQTTTTTAILHLHHLCGDLRYNKITSGSRPTSHLLQSGWHAHLGSTSTSRPPVYSKRPHSTSCISSRMGLATSEAHSQVPQRHATSSSSHLSYLKVTHYLFGT